MARDGWLEQRTRIPFAGIISMVLVVALVAIFLRSGLESVLPREDVGVTAESERELNLRGSASFQGERDVPLAYKERLQGMLTHSGGTVKFTVDVPERLLIFEQNGRAEEVLLVLNDEGTGLVATFEFAGNPATVVALPAERELRFAREGLPSVAITLSDVVAYEGYFLFAGEQYSFSYLPSASEARVEGERIWTVPLTRAGDAAVGTWRRDGVAHPIEVEWPRMVAVIGELW